MFARTSLVGLALCVAVACTPASPSAGEIVPIHTVQGAGGESPLAGDEVAIRGIVSGDFQAGDADTQRDLGGFFVQEERPDGDAQTSEGLFVFDDASRVDVEVGDRVEVRGEVQEFFGETQVVAAEVSVVGRGTVTPTVLTLPAPATVASGDGAEIADLEAYEGMLVRVRQPLTVIGADELSDFGALLLSADGPIEQFTNANEPSVQAYRRHRARVARASLVLDDGARAARVSPPHFLFPEARRSLRLGAEITGLTGNLRYSRGSGNRGRETYRLMPTQEVRFDVSNPRPTAPPAVGGSLRVMSLNALNYFTTLDDGSNRCGPAGDSGCRGANSRAELNRQRDKLVTAIDLAGADVVGLMEIENNASASLESLVDGLNVDADDRWAYVDTGTIGADAIRVAFLYDSTTVEPVGEHAVLDAKIDARFDSDKNRPALAQTFRARNGGSLTVVVNHFKSKGSSCDDVGDPNARDGQGNCNGVRTRAASALAAWLASDPTGSDDADILIIGDLNAYAAEDPLRALLNAGYDDLLAGGDQPSYSFVFRGQRGALDHALASPSLRAQVRGAAEWHINADEPAELDYNLERPRDAGWFSASTPYRASDHDPVIVGIDLTQD